MKLDIHIQVLVKNDGLTRDTSKAELTLLVIEALNLQNLMKLGWVIEVDARVIDQAE
jgi:hypothetical protein